MRRTARPLVVALIVAALGLGLLALFPTRDACRASGREVDPTGRHCLAADGYVQLREHVLFHASEVLVAAAILIALGAFARWVVRRRSGQALRGRGDAAEPGNGGAHRS